MGKKLDIIPGFGVIGCTVGAQNGEFFMEITRKALKERAKDILVRRYWTFFFIGLLQYVILGFGGININLQGLQNITNYPAFFTVIGGSFVLSVLVNIFLANPFRVGYCSFILQNSGSYPEVDYSALWKVFKENYISTVKTMFLRDLFTALWSIPLYLGVAMSYAAAVLIDVRGNYAIGVAMYAAAILLMFPGAVLTIYKDYSYSMTEYIIAEHPNTACMDAIRESRNLMRGYTFFAFVLDLSFIGWYLLGMLLCGIGTLFVNPYRDTVKAEFYRKLRAKKLYDETGYILR